MSDVPLYSKETEKKIALLRQELEGLMPQQASEIASLDNIDLLRMVESQTVPALIGSWEQTRGAIIKVLMLMDSITNRKQYGDYIDALDSVPEYLDSHMPPYIEGCNKFDIIGNKGKAEIHGCSINREGLYECSGRSCPMPDAARPEKYQRVKCPLCKGEGTSPCTLCGNIGVVEKGKICPDCNGRGGHPTEGSDEVVTICITCSKSGVNPDWGK